MSNSIAPSLRAWGSFSAQPGRASGREPVPDSDGRRRSAWSSTDSSFRPRAPWRHGAGVHELVLADVDAHVRGDASAPGGEEHQVAGTQVLLVLDGFALGALLARGAGSSRPAISRKTCRTRPLQSKPSEASSPPHAWGADGFQAARRVRAGWGRWVLAPGAGHGGWRGPGGGGQLLGGAGDPGQGQRQKGRTAGRQGGRGGSVFSRRRCHCVTSGNRSGRHGLARGCGTPGKPAERAQRRRSSPALQHYCNGIKFHYICRAMQHPDRAIVTSFAE